MVWEQSWCCQSQQVKLLDCTVPFLMTCLENAFYVANLLLILIDNGASIFLIHSLHFQEPSLTLPRLHSTCTICSLFRTALLVYCTQQREPEIHNCLLWKRPCVVFGEAQKCQATRATHRSRGTLWGFLSCFGNSNPSPSQLQKDKPLSPPIPHMSQGTSGKRQRQMPERAVGSYLFPCLWKYFPNNL